jgi:acetyl esterase/lipase
MTPMRTRREFLRWGVLGAAAFGIVGCSRPDDEDRRIEGIQPIRYGSERSQIAELLLPRTFGPYAVVVLVHGGWWADGWDRRLVRNLARDLARNGYATWNLEYRLVGEDGGGWPATFEDVAAGIDKLGERARDYNIDLDQVAFVGHSAGGHLALWAAAREHFPPGAVGADPDVVPRSVVALAPVTDLVAAAEQDLGDGAVQALMGGTPDEVPLSYLAGSPSALPAGSARHLLVHAPGDDIVPIEQSTAFVERLRAENLPVEMMEVPGDHFTLIDPDGDTWLAVRERLDDLLRPGAADQR